MDRFVMTSAGGLFSSTINKDVTLEIDEKSLTGICHVVELGIEPTRCEAIAQTSRTLTNVKGNIVLYYMHSNLYRMNRTLQVVLYSSTTVLVEIL